MINKVSEKTKDAIKRKSAYSLPDRPSDQGMKPDEIKRAFWQPIVDVTNSTIAELDRVIDEINNSSDVPLYLINYAEKLSPGAQVIDMGADDFVPAITKDVRYSYGITKAGDLCCIAQRVEEYEFTGVFFIKCITSLSVLADAFLSNVATNITPASDKKAQLNIGQRTRPFKNIYATDFYYTWLGADGEWYAQKAMDFGDNGGGDPTLTLGNPYNYFGKIDRIAKNIVDRGTKYKGEFTGNYLLEVAGDMNIFGDSSIKIGAGPINYLQLGFQRYVYPDGSQWRVPHNGAIQIFPGNYANVEGGEPHRGFTKLKIYTSTGGRGQIEVPNDQVDDEIKLSMWLPVTTGDDTPIPLVIKRDGIYFNGIKQAQCGTVESFTIQPSAWTALANKSPFTYSATVTAAAPIGDDTVVELINSDAVAFARYGFSIGAVSGQSITVYSVGAPTESTVLKIKIGG